MGVGSLARSHTGRHSDKSMFDGIAKLWAIFDRKERRGLVLLLLLILLLAFVEMVGVSSIMPFLGVAANPDLIRNNELLARVYEALGFESDPSFLIFLGVVVTAFIVIQNLFTIVVKYAKARFTHMRGHSMACRLLEKYLSQPYVFFLNQNSTDLSKNVLGEVQQVVGGYLTPMLDGITDVVVCIAVVGVLVAVDPLVAFIVAATVGGVYGLIFMGVKRWLGRLGRRRMEANAERFKTTIEAMEGIKDVKLLGKERFFLDRFAKPSKRMARAAIKIEAISKTPSFLLNAIVYGGIVSAITAIMVLSDDVSHYVPIIGLYVLAGSRLMPKVQNLFTALSKVRAFQPVVEMIFEQLEHDGALPGAPAPAEGTVSAGAPAPADGTVPAGARPVPRPPRRERRRLRRERRRSRREHRLERKAQARRAAKTPRRPLLSALDVTPLPFQQQLELQNITFTYPGTTEPVIHGQSLTIKRNTTIGLVGSTGCGKTTLVDIILGLLRPDAAAAPGTILVDNTPLTEDNLRSWQANLGYVPQAIYLSDDTVTHNIAFGIPQERIDIDAVHRAARIANLETFIEKELPRGYDTPIGERGLRLSGGQRQRLGIARALYTDPNILVMDEATSALDGVTESVIMDAIENLTGSKTIILIAHRLATLQDADTIYMMEKGRIIASGTYRQLMTENPQFQRMARVSE